MSKNFASTVSPWIVTLEALAPYRQAWSRPEGDPQPLPPGIDPLVYVCGPTVYDFAHIGNARPPVVFDTLFRLLRHVDHVNPDGVADRPKKLRNPAASPSRAPLSSTGRQARAALGFP